MDNRARTQLAHYGQAVVFTAAAVLLRWLLDPWLGAHLPLGTLILAVAGAVWVGGYGPALFATILGYLACRLLFIEPRGTLTIGDSLDYARILIYVLYCSITIALGEGLRAARRRADDSLQSVREKLQIVTDCMAAPVMRCSRDFCYVWVSRPYADWLGRPPEAIVGRPIVDVIGQAEFDKLRPHFEQVLAGQIVSYEDAVKYQGVGQRWINAVYTPTLDAQGAINGWVAVVIDITRRKRAETRQQLLWEAATVLLTSDSPDAMLRTLFAKIEPHLGLDSYFNFMVNEADGTVRLESCLGIPEASARAINRIELGQVLGRTVAQQRQAIVAAHMHAADDPTIELLNACGIRSYVCHPLLAGERLLGTLSFASRSKDQFEAEELDFLRTIARYLAAAYERLQLIQQLRQADRRKDEFLATLAHELRNPLAPLRNAAHILRLIGSHEADAESAKDIIDRQLRQMTRLVDDLLDVSRITRGKIDLRKEALALTEIIAGAIESSRPVVEAHEHELEVTLPAEPIFVEGDMTRLAQVFMKLLNNAAKYTPPGGRIWFSAARDGNEVVVGVKDEGIGLPADMLSRVFEMFTQVDRSLERTSGGLGIGLTLVRSLVEMHGGRVEARSDGPGKGSEFVVRLPITPHQAVQQPLKPGRVLSVRPHCRVLVVDDNRDAADSLAAMLRFLGFEVHTAYDGAEAVAAAGSLRPDVVLLDIGLPKLNGYEVARRIRQESWGNDVLLVALTGWGQEEDRRLSEEAGFDHHLIKPADLSVLEKLVAGVDSPPQPV